MAGFEALEQSYASPMWVALAPDESPRRAEWHRSSSMAPRCCVVLLGLLQVNISAVKRKMERRLPTRTPDAVLPSTAPCGDDGTLRSATWVMSSYLAMGAVYMGLGSTTNVLYLDLGLSVQDAAWYPSVFLVPYMLKPLWAPLLESFSTKKRFVVWIQTGLAVCALLASWAVGTAAFLPATVAVFLLMGGLGSAMDTANDGVYLAALDRQRQTRFTGYQTMGWMLGPVVTTGLLVSFVGRLQRGGVEVSASWQLAWLAVASMLAAAAVWHRWMLPERETGEHSLSLRVTFHTAKDTVHTFVRKPGVWSMVAFAALYRTSQGFLDKIGQTFLKAPRYEAGLGLDNETLGWLNGTLGSLGIAAGTFLGARIVKTWGLPKSLPWLCLAFNAPNALYLLLAVLTPERLGVIGAAVFFEKFWYGAGAVAHILYMMHELAPGPYPTAHFAYGTALMGLCMSLTGMIGALLFPSLGYQAYFVIVILAALPSVVVTLRAPHGHASAR